MISKKSNVDMFPDYLSHSHMIHIFSSGYRFTFHTVIYTIKVTLTKQQVKYIGRKTVLHTLNEEKGFPSEFTP